MASKVINVVLGVATLAFALLILPIPGVDLLDIPAVAIALYLFTRKKKVIG